MPVVLVTCLHLQRHFDHFRPQYSAMGVQVVLPPISGQRLDASAMLPLMQGIDAVIAGDDVIDEAVLVKGKASGLKAIIKWGIGTDGIDKAAASRLEIPVFNTPGVFSDEVADLAMSHLLLLARRTHLMHASVLEGQWFKAEGRSLAGLTAGIIGLGSIGRGIGCRAKAFGMELVGYDVRVVEGLHLRQVELDALYGLSDVIFVACNLTAENKHLVSRDAFARMRDGALLINVARGPLVDQGALVDALRTGKVAGAGLDVFEEEPLPPDDPLREFSSRCIFSTHNGSNTVEAVARINQMTTEIAFSILGLKQLDHFTPNRVA